MAENDQQTTVIGSDSHFKGELTFERTARIVGRFDGKITGKGELQIEQNARCEADIDSATANVDGTVEGNVSAKDTVRLNANGVVRGDITASKMVMAEGASFHGVCAVGPDASSGGGGGGRSGGGRSGSGGAGGIGGGGAEGGSTGGAKSAGQGEQDQGNQPQASHQPPKK